MNSRSGRTLAMAAMAALGAAAVGSSTVVPHRDAVPAIVAAPKSRKRRKNKKKSSPERKASLAERTAERIEHLRKQKHGVDRLGNYANRERREKKAIRRALGLTTGRAWRRWYKQARRRDRAQQVRS